MVNQKEIIEALLRGDWLSRRGVANRIKAEGIAPPDGWQPIETAPKRKVVDLWLVSTRSGRGFRVADCQWDKKEKDWVQDGQGFCFHYLVTHWMPLPEPPKGVSDEQ